MSQHPMDCAPIPCLEPSEGEARQPEPPARREMLPGLARIPMRHQRRDQRHRQDEGEEHCGRERNGERAKKISHHSAQQPEGSKDDYRRQSGAGHGPEDLIGSSADDLESRLIPLLREPPLDVLDDDHGIVNDDPDGDREPAQAHQVERISGEHQTEQCDGDRQRKGERRGQRGAPFAEKEEEDDHRQPSAQQHGVADAAHRLPHQRGLVIHGFEPDCRR